MGHGRRCHVLSWYRVRLRLLFSCRMTNAAHQIHIGWGCSLQRIFQLCGAYISCKNSPELSNRKGTGPHLCSIKEDRDNASAKHPQLSAKRQFGYVPPRAISRPEGFLGFVCTISYSRFFGTIVEIGTLR